MDLERTHANGFNLYLENKGVVLYAVHRLGIYRNAADYDDLVHEGMLSYLRYFLRYQDDLSTKAALEKFNRIAGKIVFLDLRGRRMQAVNRQKIEQRLEKAAENQMPQAADRLETGETMSTLYQRLTPRERQVLILRYYQQFDDVSIAAQLAISKQRVGELRRQITAKYTAMIQASLLETAQP